MYQFLAKIGRHKYFELVVPMLAVSATTIYGGVQFGLHNQLRDLLGAQSPSGRREKLTDHLRELIQQAHEDCKAHGFIDQNRPIPYLETRSTTIKWFASSTLEPISFGTTKLTWGALIGLPNFFNYTSPEDIPDSMFEVKMISLFRSAQDVEQEEKCKLEPKKMNLVEHEPNPLGPRRIKRDSTEGEEYAESLILSDDAKKFSIARELFLVDTYRAVMQAGILFLSLTTSIAVARSFVKRVALVQAHITRRIPVYMTAATLAYGLNHFASLVNNQLTAARANSKARNMGPSYQTGADEYYAKRAKRFQILRIN